MPRNKITPTPKPQPVSEQGGIPRGFTLRHTLRGHDDLIGRIAWSPDGRMLASPSNDGTIHIWDAESGEALAVLSEYREYVHSVAWSPDGRTLVSVRPVGRMLLWDTNT